MGSYLGSYLTAPEPLPPSPAPESTAPQPKPAGHQPDPDERPVVHIHPQLLGSTEPLPQIPPELKHLYIRRVRFPEAWRNFPKKLPTQTNSGQDQPCTWDSYKKLCLWNDGSPRRACSPVTLKIASLESRGSLFKVCPAPEKTADPSARETVPRALSQCNKGKRKLERPLWFESPDDKRKRHSPRARRSAFKPVVRNGVTPSFVPRPGPLKRRPCSSSEAVCQEKAVPRRDVQPFLSASQPAAGTAPARVTRPPLERWVKMQHSWFPGSPPVHGVSTSESHLPLDMPSPLASLAPKCQDPVPSPRDFKPQ